MCCRSHGRSCTVWFFFKQKTAYDMRISDWSSDVCSSDLHALPLLLATALAPLAASAQDVDITYQSFTLDNGLRVVVHEDHKAPIVAVNVWYHVGSKNEQPGKTGFAHLFEHQIGRAHV